VDHIVTQCDVSDKSSCYNAAVTHDDDAVIVIQRSFSRANNAQQLADERRQNVGDDSGVDFILVSELMSRRSDRDDLVASRTVTSQQTSSLEAHDNSE